MIRLPIKSRTLAMIAVIAPLLILFIYVALRSGPLAPVWVTVTTVENKAISPAIFGIGTLEARYTYKIGPTVAGRVKQVNVNVGDLVHAGQLLGEMEPIDLDNRIVAQDASSKRAMASVLAAEAQIQDATARKDFAKTQAKRYEDLLLSRSVSAEAVDTKRQENKVAESSLAASNANLEAARQELARTHADRGGLSQQRTNLRLVTPVDGLVASRDIDPGTTVIAGQSIVVVIDPKSLWVNVRFEQLSASGLQAGLPARIELRSQKGHAMTGTVLRVEPFADAVTEEILAKIVFDKLPEPLPPIGELVEVTVALAKQPSTPVVPNASVQHIDGQLGVWTIEDGDLRFAPIRIGATDLDGNVQVVEGLEAGQKVVLYSQHALKASSRIKIVKQIPGVPSSGSKP
ncbi:MAG: efflux RND transporter periplasmic adaptor subunit [Methylotenera sp.]|nr:efflux RND transporter periplasmic adaptor subunit [Methylotenera sp.]